MNSLSIGVLLPSSSIVPMGKDFETGLKVSLKQHLSEVQGEVELIPEFIGQGSRAMVEDAINKLLNYHHVDMITGILSNRIAMEMAEKFEKHKKPLLINNIGEHIPDPKFFNPYIFINSNHIWQQVWSLGNWAVKKFGNRGMFVGSIYDAGYCFTSMFQLGMLTADPKSEMPFAIAHLSEGAKTADPKSVFEHIEKLNPDFILSAFCGKEATVFQEEYIRSGYHLSKPLLALPYLLQSYHAESNQSIEVFTTLSSYQGLREIEFSEVNSDNPFKALGAETGLIIAKAIELSNDQNLLDALRKVKVNSFRGMLQIDSSKPGDGNEIYLVKNKHHGDKKTIEREIIEKLDTVYLQDDALLELLNEPSSGWFNPYLGV